MVSMPASNSTLRQAAGPGSDRAARPRPVELHLLRGFQLVAEGQTVDVPLSVQRLLAFLALHDRPMDRVYVAGKLWLECSERRAHANLRSTLWRAHRCGHELVRAIDSRLELATTVRVDLHMATADARRLVDGSAAQEDLSLSRDALAGELLPDWYDDWALQERERYRQLCLHALESLAQQLTRKRRFGEAADAALAAIATDPLRESARRALIAVHLAEGNSSEAVREYRRFRALLARELDLAPSDQLEELMRQVAPS
jgi:DNA-binding SARP family transcriptional activator